MPRYPEPKITTPFGKVLVDFMWTQRPPWTTGRLATTLNTSRQTVNNWVYRGFTPGVDTVFAVLSMLGIPIDTLIAAYREVGMPVPPQLLPDSTPTPRPYQPPAPPQDEWERLLRQTEDVMRAAGLADEDIAAVLAHIQETRRGARPLQRHIIAEHTDPPEQTTPHTTPQTESPTPPQNGVSGTDSRPRRPSRR